MAELATMTGAQILDLPMDPTSNDAQATSVRDYLGKLAGAVWRDGEGFSGKRPFGNSGWGSELMVPLVKANLIVGAVDQDGYLADYDGDAGWPLIEQALEALRGGVEAEPVEAPIFTVDDLRRVMSAYDNDFYDGLRDGEGGTASFGSLDGTDDRGVLTADIDPCDGGPRTKFRVTIERLGNA